MMAPSNQPPFPVSGLLFDLDDTLYDVPAMKLHVARNIQRYMVTKLGIFEEEVVDLCMKCYLEYGTTLAGLVTLGYKIDTDDWHAFVHHTLPYEEYLKPDPELRRILSSISVPMHIFTNADRVHARRCMDLLGISDLFVSVISFEEVQEAAVGREWKRHGRPIVCKPGHQAYLLALELSGLNPSSTVWFDDSTRNVTAGKKAGMYSVLVGRTGVEGTDADCQIRSIHDLPAAMPWLVSDSCCACVCDVEGEASAQTRRTLDACACSCHLDAEEGLSTRGPTEIAVSCVT